MSSFFNSVKNIPSSIVAGLTAVFCAGLLAFAFILEIFVSLTPCPLCIAQRFFFVLIAVVAVGFLWWPQLVTKKIVGIKITAFSLLGGAIALRQVWMQWHVADIDSSGCAVLFGSFFEKFLQALGGTGDCAKVDWTFLQLSIAEWSAVSFLALFSVGMWFLWQGFWTQKNEI